MRGAVALVLAVTACGGGGPPPVEKPKAEPVSERKAEKDAKGLVGEIYGTIGRANTDGLMALVANPVFVLGPRKKDALATRADALVALREVLEAEKAKKFPVHSGNLSVVASPGGLSAWAVDAIEVEGSAMAVTVVLSNADDFWVVAAASVAMTPSMKSVRAELKKEAVVPPALQAQGDVPDAAEAAADHFKKGFATPSVWGDDLIKRGDAVVIGPSAEEVTRGKSAIEKLWKKREKANVRYTQAGDMIAGATADGQLVWVSTPVVRFEDDEDEPLPLRLFGVYEKAGNEWKLIALQEALAFDEPGQGASFKKIAAPAVKAEEPPPKPKTEKTDKPKKKKKKKKKSSDD